MKWKNYSSADNTWEPEENVDDCDQLLEEFERNRAEKILGVKIENNMLFYLVEMKDEQKAEIVPAHEVQTKWPQKLIAYLERHTEWIVPERRVTVFAENELPEESQNPTGRALEISCM